MILIEVQNRASGDPPGFASRKSIEINISIIPTKIDNIIKRRKEGGF